MCLCTFALAVTIHQWGCAFGVLNEGLLEKVFQVEIQRCTLGRRLNGIANAPTDRPFLVYCDVVTPHNRTPACWAACAVQQSDKCWMISYLQSRVRGTSS